MANRSGDWLRQADADLEHAELSAREGDYEWSCFAAQQAAEKALKGLIMFSGGEPWGHSITSLAEALPVDLQPPLETVGNKETPPFSAIMRR